MIVISENLVLPTAPGNAPNADNPLVGWRNLTAVGNIAADTESPGFPALNLANPSTYLKWRAAGTTDQFITIAHNAIDPIDFVAVAGHNFGSGQVTVSIEGDDGSGFAEIVQETMLPGDGPALFRFSPISLEAVRIKLQPGSVIPQAAVVYVGSLLVLQRRIYVGHRPLPYNRSANVVTGFSEMGQFLGRIVLGEMTETSLELQNITPAFFRSDMEPWLRDAVQRPFFFAWRPGAYPREVGYCWATNDGNPTNQRSNGMMQVSLNLQGIAK